MQPVETEAEVSGEKSLHSATCSLLVHILLGILEEFYGLYVRLFPANEVF